MIAADDVRRRDFPVVTGNRSQRRSLPRGIAGDVDRGVADALEEVVELQAAVLGFDIGSSEVQPLERRAAAGGMDRDVGIDRDGLAL